jgi:peptidoglycan/xylan/chitin deacetylase (PgdA/CDA1 family)
VNFKEFNEFLQDVYTRRLKPKVEANPHLSWGVGIGLAVCLIAMLALLIHPGKADEPPTPQYASGEGKQAPPSHVKALPEKQAAPMKEPVAAHPRPIHTARPATPGPGSAAASLPLTPINPALISFQPTPALLMRGPENPPRVALTFDAGSDAKAVPLILQTLEEHHVHATFFLTGRFCEKFPNECRAIADAGMEIGNHSYSHPKFTRLTHAQILSQLDRAEEAIVKACGRGAKPLFRFPYGDCDSRTQKIVAAAGYQPIRWTLDSLDAFGKPKTADFVVERINSRIQPGYITLMHVSCVTSAEALPRIFEQLDKMGATVVPASELLLGKPDASPDSETAPAQDIQPAGQ